MHLFIRQEDPSQNPPSHLPSQVPLARTGPHMYVLPAQDAGEATWACSAGKEEPGGGGQATPAEPGTNQSSG